MQAILAFFEVKNQPEFPETGKYTISQAKFRLKYAIKCNILANLLQHSFI